MRLNSVSEWKNQDWTHLYEAALFEQDPVMLCAYLWNAQLAILSREQEIQPRSLVGKREQVALKKALEILRHLQRLSGLDDQVQDAVSLSFESRATRYFAT